LATSGYNTPRRKEGIRCVGNSNLPFHHSESNGNCWPTAEQQLLLRACLLNETEALQAWNEWQQHFESGSTDATNRRLFPALYSNLTKQKITGPLIDRFKEEYNRAWVHNQFAFNSAAKIISCFQQAGIATILLKGSGLILTIYEDAGLRPMADIDVLVRRADASSSICLLESLGWISKYKDPFALIPFENADEFTDHSNQKLDLHWRVLWEGNQKSTDEDFWDASIPAQIGEVETRTLSASDHLLHVCVHGAKWNDTSPIRWVIDAMKILTSESFEVDWIRVLRQSRERRLSLPMRDTLTYLVDTLAAPVPPAVLRELHNEPTSMRERQFYKIRLEPNNALKTIPVTWHWVECLVLECRGNVFQRLSQFMKYLQSLWALDRLRDVPLHFVGRIRRRLYELLEWRFSNRWNPSKGK